MNNNIIQEGDDFKVEYNNLGHLQAQIDILEDSVPSKDKKEEYNIWKKQMNALMSEYNKISNSKIYKLIS